MTSRWIQHVKDFAKNNNITYPKALIHPDIKNDYTPATKSVKQPRVIKAKKEPTITSIRDTTFKGKSVDKPSPEYEQLEREGHERMKQQEAETTLKNKRKKRQANALKKGKKVVGANYVIYPETIIPYALEKTIPKTKIQQKRDERAAKAVIKAEASLQREKAREELRQQKQVQQIKQQMENKNKMLFINKGFFGRPKKPEKELDFIQQLIRQAQGL